MAAVRLAAAVPEENSNFKVVCRMSQFEGKDYGEYFNHLEKSLYSTPEKNQQRYTAHQKKPSEKRAFGAVISIRRYKSPVLFICALLIMAVVLAVTLTPNKAESKKPNGAKDNTVSTPTEKVPQKKNYFARRTGNVQSIPSNIESQNVIIVNVTDNTVVAERNATARCYPASTTKIMTALVAIENITDMSDTFTMTYAITDPLYIEGATVAGFSNGEAVNMTDLLYGTILPSGADACVGLAIRLAGSEEAFVELMNEKARELGLKNTHFMNSSGLFHENHYTTAEDMAVILRAAMDNTLCRRILSTYEYTTASTPQHPDGIPLTSTLFSYMYGTEPEGADILGGKTGFVNESGYCIAAFGKSDANKEYICVTLGGTTHWPAIYNQIDLFTQFAK